MISKRPRRKRIKREEDATSVAVGSDELINRELSWLQFNRRVLAEAQDPRNPLLERIKFLTIVSSNLDEFFMNRVGSLKQRMTSGWFPTSPDGLSVRQQLEEIRRKVVDLQKAQDDCYLQMIKPAMTAGGINLLAWEDLSAEERIIANRYYQLNVFPILTPQAVDPGHPFPFLSNLSVSLGVLLKYPDRDEQVFARVKVPQVIPQLLRVDTATSPELFRFVSLSNVIRENLGSLFPGMIVQMVLPFRVTRNAALDIDDYEVDDLVEVLEEELRERRFAKVVRLELGPKADSVLVHFLMEEIELSDDDVYESVVDFDHLALRELADLNLPKLKPETWSPVIHSSLTDDDANIFSILRAGDVLVHHPYESFSSSVERFLRAAVDDPRVVAIKMTLYRAGDKSPLVPMLVRAAENEKQVVCLIEVKASFDEARNIRLAQTLEDAGVHVMYGVVGLKTHAKVTLVARQEPEGIRCYGHLSTGNYNFQTARVYTDLGLFTSNVEICEDLVDLFHYLTGRSLKREYRRVLVSPHNMKEKLLALINREIASAQAGKPAHIIFKANSLEDVAICRALTKAAQSGVVVDLIIRGICCLRPLSGGKEHLRVVSTIGRFLEHSRILYFRNAQEDPIDGEFLIASADLMHRNLHRRVEVAVPILERPQREKSWEILQLHLADKRQSWNLQNSGEYVRVDANANSDSPGVQQTIARLTRERSRGSQVPFGDGGEAADHS